MNESAAEPSPQSTETAQGLSLTPSSENEPSANELLVPSFAVWFAGPVSDGATFATVTSMMSTASVSATLIAPSSSTTLIETNVVFGPSAKWQSKLPPAAVLVSEPGTSVPWAPQPG